MKYIYLVAILLLSVSCNGNSSERPEPQTDKERTANMMADAARYSRYLESFNTDSLVELTLPAYIELEGGKEKYIKSLQQSSDIKHDFKSTSITIEDKGILIKGEGNCYYSVLEQEVNQQFKDTLDEESVFTRINIVAESQDGGKNWKFAFMRIPDLEQYYPSNTVQELSKYLEY